VLSKYFSGKDGSAPLVKIGPYAYRNNTHTFDCWIRNDPISLVNLVVVGFCVFVVVGCAVFKKT